MPPGRWKDRIEKAISRSRYFIFCLSEASLKKTGDEKPGFVDHELQTAWKFASEQDETVFTIIPVRLEDCDRGDMRLSGWQQYDLFENWQGGLDTLAVNIGGKSLSDTLAEDERALSIYEAAINIKPHAFEAWYNKGIALSKLGRLDEALEASNKAIELEPSGSLTWFVKGFALGVSGREWESQKAYKKGNELEKNLKKYTLQNDTHKVSYAYRFVEFGVDICLNLVIFSQQITSHNRLTGSGQDDRDQPARIGDKFQALIFSQGTLPDPYRMIPGKVARWEERNGHFF